MLALISLPTPSEFFQAIGAWSSAFFDELKPILFFFVGIGLAVAFGYLILRLVSFVIEKIKGED